MPSRSMTALDRTLTAVVNDTISSKPARPNPYASAARAASVA